MKVRFCSENSLVCVEEDEILIVLSGSMESRLHNNSRLYKIQSKYNPGDIIGAFRLDHGRSTNYECWNVCI